MRFLLLFFLSSIAALNLPPLRIPQRANVLSENPLIFTVPDLISADDCTSLLNQAAKDDRMQMSNAPKATVSVDKLWPLMILSPLFAAPTYIKTNSISDSLPIAFIALIASISLAFGAVRLLNANSSNTLRTSRSLALNEVSDQKQATINLIDNVEKVLNIPRTNFEAPVITIYDVGGRFAPHNDASPTLGSEWADLVGQRIATAIVGLKSMKKNAGGETKFVSAGIEVPVIAGQGLFFFPADFTTKEADERTLHEGSAVIGSENNKFITQIFVRENEVPPPLGLPSIDDPST